MLNYSIQMPATTIGIITFVLSVFGVCFGNHFGKRMNHPVGAYLDCGLK
ncbi:manganese efflux pump [Massilibacteroides sp.]